MTNSELLYITGSIREIAANIEEWGNEYDYCKHTNEFNHHLEVKEKPDQVSSWFNIHID